MSKDSSNKPKNDDLVAELNAALNKKTTTTANASQNDIDSLFTNAGDTIPSSHATQRGIKAMISKALDSYERLPMLEVIFDKFLRLLSTSLRNLTEDNVELDIIAINSMRFGNYINAIPLPALVSIFKAQEWDHFGLFVPDYNLTFSLVDILFGGKRSNRPMKQESRPYTSIEQSIIRHLGDIILEDLAESFAALSPVNFKFERMETDPRFASIARHSDSVIMVQIDVRLEERRGKMEILFPYEALEPIKELLLQVFIGEQFGVDTAWENIIIKQIEATPISLEAVIKGNASKMSDIINLKIGSTIMLENSPDDDIAIYSGDKQLASGKLGKLGNRVAISLNESIKEYKQKRMSYDNI